MNFPKLAWPVEDGIQQSSAILYTSGNAAWFAGQSQFYVGSPANLSTYVYAWAHTSEAGWDSPAGLTNFGWELAQEETNNASSQDDWTLLRINATTWATNMSGFADGSKK